MEIEHAATLDDELARRVAATPADAEIRTIFVHIVDDALEREPSLRARVGRLPKRPRGYTMTPVRAYLEELHRIGAAIAANAADGIARLHARAASFLVDHPGARLFVTARDRDPVVLLGRLERSRSLMASYGEWRVSGTRGDLTLTARDEWVWLEHVWSPIVRSVFPACGLAPPHLELHPEGAYGATMRVRW